LGRCNFRHQHDDRRAKQRECDSRQQQNRDEDPQQSGLDEERQQHEPDCGKRREDDDEGRPPSKARARVVANGADHRLDEKGDDRSQGNNQTHFVCFQTKVRPQKWRDVRFVNARDDADSEESKAEQ